MRLFRSLPFWFIVICLGFAWWAGREGQLIFVVERISLDPAEVEKIKEREAVAVFVDAENSVLWAYRDSAPESRPSLETEYVRTTDADGAVYYYQLTLLHHRGIWSLFPAFVTIVLCFLLREPLSALLGGIVTGALVMGRYDVTGAVLIPGLGSSGAALVILLYLCFLGGLLGIWSRNGAALAFAQWVTKHFVRGPKTAKVAAWTLGVCFFQGGTISTLLVGTTVKPVADAEKISHEELAYIVDSTASPIAILLPFNAWPFYVQGLIFVGGVSVLATEASRVSFFFGTIPLSFYAILAVAFTFLLSIDRLPFISSTFRAAIRRAREDGKLDRPGSTPLQTRRTDEVNIPKHYQPVAWEFIIPLALIVGIAIGTMIATGTPNVLWAFGAALTFAFLSSRMRGLTLRDLVQGFTSGLQNVVYGAVILLLAVVIGGLIRESGGGLFLVELLGESLPHAVIPLFLFVLTLIIAFSTGTSWGTFAVTFPLAMPLAWAIAVNSGVDHPVLFLQLCFVAVLNGSVFGDQCSPISDTTVLSSLATGCDLMDHVRTQIVPCSFAALFAVIGWTLLALFVV
jgi:Na+/H+ antiporter NhaC